MAVLALSTSLHGHAPTAGADPGRLHPRRRAGDRRATAGGRGDDGDHAGCHQTQSSPDPREHAGARPRRTRSGTSRTAILRCVADFIGIHTGDYLITEAGFGADMGAERFFNIKCRVSGLVPDAAVIVTTVRALKAHSGRHRIIAGRPLPAGLLEENPDEVVAGGSNLRKQIENVLVHGVTPVVAINAFPGDFDSEYAAIRAIADSMGVRLRGQHPFSRRRGRCRRPGRGGGGRSRGAQRASASSIPPTYRSSPKIETIATLHLWSCGGRPPARQPRPVWTCSRRTGSGTSPSASPRPTCPSPRTPSLKGAPTGWRLPVREVRASAGAGFVYAVCGDMRTMPGLSSHPAAEQIDIDENGDVVGLS